jgi:hypothetical protein
MAMVVTPTQVRDYMSLNTPPSSSRYSDETIGSNIRAAQSKLEFETHRKLVDVSDFVYRTTTMIRAQVPIPGFRTFDTVTWGGATMSVGFSSTDPNTSCWAIPDDLMSGTYVALQFRAWRADSDAPWWLSDPLWYDKLLDSPFFPGNRGGGYAWTSMPNDLYIKGSAGWAPGEEPDTFLQAVKVLSAFYTERPGSILADVAITPSGAVQQYSQLPPEARDFIADFKIGLQVASV